jgi:hypothetical protein
MAVEGAMVMSPPGVPLAAVAASDAEIRRLEATSNAAASIPAHRPGDQVCNAPRVAQLRHVNIVVVTSSRKTATAVT